MNSEFESFFGDSKASGQVAGPVLLRLFDLQLLPGCNGEEVMALSQAQAQKVLSALLAGGEQNVWLR